MLQAEKKAGNSKAGVLKWHTLGPDDRAQIMERFGISDEDGLFGHRTTAVQYALLPFFRNFLLYRFTDYATMPTFSLKYLSDGYNFYYLDGTNAALYTVNVEDPVELNADNLVDYLHFFFENVPAPHGHIMLVEEPESLELMEVLSPAKREEILGQTHRTAVQVLEEGEGFYVMSTLYYAGTLFWGRVWVGPDGMIELLDQHPLLVGIPPDAGPERLY